MSCSGTGQMLDALRQVCPGFTSDGRPIRTETSLLLPGRITGVPVLAKHPVDPRPFWQNRCRHEIAVYQALARAASVPVLTPALVTADPGYPVLVITRLSGQPLHPRRYPSGTRVRQHAHRDAGDAQGAARLAAISGIPRRQRLSRPVRRIRQRPDTTRRPETHHLAVRHRHAAPAA